MLTKISNEIKIDTIKVLLESYKGNQNNMYEVAQAYLSMFQERLLNREEYYK